MKQKLLIFLKIAVTSTLLYWVGRGMNLDLAAQNLTEANPGYLVLTLVIIWFGHFLCVIRWDILLRIFGIPMKIWPLVRIYGIGMFFNLVLPGLVGGDLVKGYLTGRDGRCSYSLSFASVFVDRDLGFVAMVFLAVLSTAFFPVTVQGYSLFIVFSVLLAFCIAANFLLFHPLAHRFLSFFFPASKYPKFGRKLESLSQAFRDLVRNPSRLAITFIISLVNQFLVIVCSWFVSLALDINAPFLYFMVFIPVTTVITMIPVSINGLGLREFSYMQLFPSIAGVSREQGALMGFLTSVIVILSGLPGAIAYLLHRKAVSRKDLENFRAGVVEEAEMS